MNYFVKIWTKFETEYEWKSLRTRTLSTGFWLIFVRKNTAALPYRTWRHPPLLPLSQYLFSQDANPQPQISKDATEKRVARTVACYRSEMDGYAGTEFHQQGRH
jgi:hypothetical protein